MRNWKHRYKEKRLVWPLPFMHRMIQEKRENPTWRCHLPVHGTLFLLVLYIFFSVWLFLIHGCLKQITHLPRAIPYFLVSAMFLRDPKNFCVSLSPSLDLFIKNANVLLANKNIFPLKDEICFRVSSSYCIWTLKT